MYLAEGEFSGQDKELVRNCPLTNRPCESNMGFLDREMTIRPNATPGYLEASIIVRNNGLKSIDEMEDKEKRKAFAIAREWANEEIKHNKEQLKYHIAARKAIIQSKELARKDKEKRSVARRSKIMSDISKYGNEWKSEDDMERFLESANTETEKVNAVQAQIRYHKHILGTDTILGKEGTNLFKLTKIGLEQLCENLKKVISQSPSYEFLDEIIPASTERISGATILSQEKRKELYEEWVAILKDKLEKEREKRQAHGAKSTAESSKSKNKDKRVIKELPDPTFLVGKRVEHTWNVLEEGKKRARKCIYTGTITRILRRSKDKLYTLFEIVYDVDQQESDDDDDNDDEEDEELKTAWEYELLMDYVNGDLTIVE